MAEGKKPYVTPTIEITDKPDNNFFVRLCYGFVEHTLGKDTKKMTTKEVIQEFLDYHGVSSPREFFNKKFNGKDNAGDSTKPKSETKVENKNPKAIQKSAESEQILNELKLNKVEYRQVQNLQGAVDRQSAIERLAGGDMTKGSCSSLAFAYIGNCNGLDVLDFRGGSSLNYFSKNKNIRQMINLPGVDGKEIKAKEEIRECMSIINSLELEQEYYFAAGQHAAIIRRTKNGAEYLEMQSRVSERNGWTPFNNTRYGTMRDTLKNRFKCRVTPEVLRIGDRKITLEKPIFIAKVDSFKNNEEFKEILGYINTDPSKQQKGTWGDVK